MTERFLEDYAVGQMFGSGRIRVTEEQIKAFAAEFDEVDGASQGIWVP